MLFVFLAVQFFFLASVAGISSDALLSAVQNTDDCPSCLALLGAFQELAVAGTDVFIAEFTSLCIGLGVRLHEFHFVCRLEIPS